MVKKKTQALDTFIDGAQTQTKQAVSNPLENSDPTAPRKYKAVAIQFNKYEFDRLDQAVAASGMRKNEFIRAALESACRKALK